MNRFTLLEHTADMGIAAEGESLAALFEQAAFGMRQVISSSAALRSTQKMLIEAVAADVEELLVNWLSELLYLFESELFLPVAIEIEAIDDLHLSAWVYGEVIDPEQFELEREIKAITYHQLQVEKTAQGWRARVFVDL